MIFNNQLILNIGPSALFDIGIEVIVPPFPTLFAKTTVELTGYERPLLLTVFVHEFDDHGILLGCPWTLDEAGFEYLLPSMEALDVGTSR